MEFSPHEGEIDWTCPIDWDHPLSRGLVGRWAVLKDQPGWKSNTLIDLTDPVYGNHGTLTNMDPATDWVASGDGYALDFDGVNDQVTMAKRDLSAGGSASVWFYARDIGTAAQMVYNFTASSNRWSIGVAGSEIRTNIYDGSSAGASIATTANAWHNVIVTTTDGSTNVSYYNGKLMTGTNISGISGSTVSMVISGRSGVPTSDPYDGQVDDLLVYNRALAANEVRQLYTLGRGGWLRRIKQYRNVAAAPAGNAPTSVIYGPLVGCLGGPI